MSENRPESTEEKVKHADEVGALKSIFLYPLVSEKAVDKIEKENKLTFIVKKEATKQDIKKAFEDEFKAKVDKINIIKDMKARKKAIITVNKQFKASNIAMKLGII